GMRIVGGPEEAVVADQSDQPRNRRLIGVARDPTLAAEVEAWFLLQRNLAVRYDGDGVHAIEPVADPSGTGFQDDDLQARETVEDAELEQRRERVAHTLRRQHVEIELRAPDVLHVEPTRERMARLERRMNAERHIEVLRGSKQAIVVGMTVRLLGNR